MTKEDNQAEPESRHFIQQIIDGDLESGKHKTITTRFPPEPNGYLHIGHAKSICLNFGLAKEFPGKCHLRFDDTNPSKEDVEFVESIKEDVKWLGWDWNDNLFHASDYFEKLYDFAVTLIKKEKAYVCDLNAEEVREYRGTLTEPGNDCPTRNRTVEENLELFQQMRDGVFEDGSKTLRAKIDMASPNINMRDPALYRIRRAHHDRTGDKWCIYPMYDFTHCLSDAIEGITHSLCSLEFQDHRPLYDWVIDETGIECHPQQIEFARLNLSYTVMSKRKLRQLVEENIVKGWDDPRMPTISGMRRRGYPAQAIRNFCDKIGLAKRENTIELALLEFCVRESLNKTANRHMGVFNPVKLVITNYPEGESETLEAINNPEDETAGKRSIPFSRELYIERDDFMEDAPKKFFRMAPGREVRLRYAYLVTCQSVVKDDAGEITEIHCTYDPETKGGNAPDGRKVKSTIHWVSAEHAVDAEIRNYELLFTEESPEAKENFLEFVNKDSLNIGSAKVEPYVSTIENKGTLQFERIGYYAFDPDSHSDKLVFNRTVPLRDPWKKAKGK